MDRSFIKDQVAKLINAYERFNVNQSQFDLWVECFKDCDERTFEQAVKNYIRTNEFPPNIAGVMNCYREIEDYRRDLSDTLHRQYKIMASTWGEPYDKETFTEFVEIVVKEPKEKRKEKAVEMTHNAVSFYHDYEYSGMTPPKLIDYLRGEI